MNLTITPRDRVILGVFTVILVGAMWGYVRWATAPASSGRAIQPTASRTLERKAELTEPVTAKSAPVTDIAPAPLPTERESTATLPRREYRFIAERNIFQPSEAKTDTPSEPTPTRSSGRSRSSGGLSEPPPLPPAPPPPPSSTPTLMASRPANLTATGVARVGDETYVLLENPQTRDIAFVRVGESAFGYEVTNAGENYVEVKQGDVAYRITLGEGKQERRVIASAMPGGPRPPFAGPMGGPFGGPFGGPSGPPQPGQQFGGRQGRQGGQQSTDWMNRVVERWNQLPEFVRDRILQRVGEFWQQMPAEQQQQIMQRFQQMGVNFNPPGR